VVASDASARIRSKDFGSVNILLLVLAVQFLPLDTADFTWAAKQVKADTVVVISYPTDARNEWICIEMHRRAVEGDVQSHCWKPKGPIDIDVWENFPYAGHYVVATLRQRSPDGSERYRYAYPIDGPDK
jgi:hypothetical protein